MAYLDGSRSGLKQARTHSETAQRCNDAAQTTEFIENRAVVLLASLDPAATVWRPLLQGMGLTVFNGFHREGLGDRPVILVSEALWRQSDWRCNLQFIRQQFPGGILCVLGKGVGHYPRLVNKSPDLWDDARSMLLVAGVDFFTLKEPEYASDTEPSA